MSRLAFLVVALSALASTVSASPIAANATEVLDKRVTHDGKATWYNVGLGACGYTDTDNKPIVAISHLIYGSGGNCNQWIAITNKANGVTKYGQTRDECMGCGQSDIDLSPSLFESLGADLGKGVLQVEWHFENKAWSP
ncbi:uncharacterized protein LAESUDRAFT_734785 [Laetiporus sulphureus 93-53]|uniref:RlpA-like protein double-psi beta-barrel domain-containing protein n=1 Tax=Laetiporus sulphureus 93-53 TaxID=1314785 RepID=A0A165GEU2_9APHY|nr:uncharacterized protein LAESUDRAFT_734785 [Laetiporus sulphureus 93-53]KZT10252.1 hypothetical protein LAESUDRAFT_734785 [Laetiporus sulphureus 93-53]